MPRPSSAWAGLFPGAGALSPKHPNGGLASPCWTDRYAEETASRGQARRVIASYPVCDEGKTSSSESFHLCGVSVLRGPRTSSRPHVLPTRTHDRPAVVSTRQSRSHDPTGHRSMRSGKPATGRNTWAEAQYVNACKVFGQSNQSNQFNRSSQFGPCNRFSRSNRCEGWERAKDFPSATCTR